MKAGVWSTDFAKPKSVARTKSVPPRLPSRYHVAGECLLLEVMRGLGMSKSRKNKRRQLAVIFVACMIVGLIAQLLVAWGFALWGPWEYAQSTRSAANWPVELFIDEPELDQQLEIAEYESFGCSAWFAYADPMKSANPELRCMFVCSSGWPWRSFRWSLRSDAQNDEGDVLPPAPGLQGGLTVPSVVRRTTIGIKRRLPIEPVLPGALLGTLFYCVLLFSVITSAQALRRTARGKKGCCVSCGYQLESCIQTCPECGCNDGKQPPSAIIDD